MDRKAALVALILILILGILPGSLGQGLVGADFAGTWEESTEDRDGDGSFEGLILKVDVEVYEPGDYGIFGTIGGLLHASSGLVSLPPGRGSIPIRFSGADMITHRPSGNLEVSLQLYTSSPDTPVRTLDLTTKVSYDPALFERGSDHPGTSITVEGSEVLINNPRVEIRLDTGSPKLTFYHPDAPDLTRASLECVRMVAFGDTNGNGAYDPGTDEDRYVTDLSRDVDWGMDLDLSAGYKVYLQGTAPMKIVGAPTASAWAAVTIALDSTAIGPQGSSQKFDISIDLLQPLDADGIAIVQEFTDLGNHSFVYSESGLPTDPERTLSLSDGEDVHATYMWTEAILLGNATPTDPAKARSSYSISGHAATIVFSYPLTDDTLVVYHDPTVGIDPSFTYGKGKEGLVNSPLIMALGLVLGLTLVMGGVAANRFGRRW